MSGIPERCPDTGTCHHACEEGHCWRQESGCCALSGHEWASTPESREAAPEESHACLESSENVRLHLWSIHGHDSRYGDDGEMQCFQCRQYGASDYKRDPIEKLIVASRRAIQQMVVDMKARGNAGPKIEVQYHPLQGLYLARLAGTALWEGATAKTEAEAVGILCRKLGWVQG